MGRRNGRRGRKKAATGTAGLPEEDTGSHPEKDLDSAAAAAAAAEAATGRHPDEDLDPAAAAATGSHRGTPDRYVFPPGWWDTHDLYEFPEDYFEFAARQIKSDPRFNAGRNKYLEWPETERCKFNALSDQLEVVEDEILEIKKERLEIQREIDRLELIPDTPLDEHYIIAFVKEMEREIQYVIFEDYLKQRIDIQHDSDALDIFKVLVQKERVHKRHKKLDFKDIKHAISVRIRDLQIERDREERELKAGKENISTSPEEDTLCEDSNEDLSSNPIGDLVKAIRQKRYCMHWDPLNELKIIEKYNRHFYFKYFLAKVLMKYSETRVMVSNVPRNYQEEDVKDLLSVCGEIVHVHVEVDQEKPWIRSADVTFKDPEGAKIAPILLDGTSLRIFPVPEPRKFTLNKETRRKFEKALRRYAAFRDGKFSLSRRR